MGHSEIIAPLCAFLAAIGSQMDVWSACNKLAAAANTETRKKEPILQGRLAFVNATVAIQLKLTHYYEICRV